MIVMMCANLQLHAAENYFRSKNAELASDRAEGARVAGNVGVEYFVGVG